MSYTLERLVDDCVIKGLHHETTKLSLKGRKIRFAMVHELPMKGFIKSNDLVLTTAIGSEDGHEKKEDLIKRVIEEASAEKACGVAFSLMSVHMLTKEMIERAEALNLPIFTIPWDAVFSDVQRDVNDAIQSSQLETYRDLQGRLFEAYFKSPDLKPAVDVLSEFLEEPVALFNMQHICLAKSGDYLIDEDSLKKWVIPIGSMKRPYGSLEVQDEAPEGNIRELIQQYIAYPLALWFNEMHVEEMTTVRLRSDLAMKLAMKNYDDYMEVVREASLLDVDLNKDYFAIVLTINAANPRLQKRVLESVVDVMAIAHEKGRSIDHAIIAGSVGNQFVFFFESTELDQLKSDDEIISLSNDLLDSMETSINEMIPNIWCLWGLSDIGSRKTDFDRMYNEALLAMHHCDNRLAKNQRKFFREARILSIMSSILGEKRIKEDAHELLSGLLEYDEGNGSMELMKTLTEFIRCNYNTSQTARSLNIHRQSLLARLEKIEDLTGMSLKKHEDLFVLEVYSRFFIAY